MGMYRQRRLEEAALEEGKETGAEGGRAGRGFSQVSKPLTFLFKDFGKGT